MPIARILVVEDDVILRSTLAEWLRTGKYEVVEAASVDEALRILSSVLTVDLVITDVEMPGSMDGLELVNRIRQTSPALPVILVSGAGFNERLRTAVVSAFFLKPYRLARLSELVSRLLPPAQAPAERRQSGSGGA